MSAFGRLYLVGDSVTGAVVSYSSYQDVKDEYFRRIDQNNAAILLMARTGEAGGTSLCLMIYRTAQKLNWYRVFPAEKARSALNPVGRVAVAKSLGFCDPAFNTMCDRIQEKIDACYAANE